MSWELKKLEDTCSLITDGAHWSPSDIGVGYSMPSVKDMTDNGFDYSNCKKISTEDFNKLKKSNCCPINGDVLIAKDGSYLKHCFEFRGDENVAILSSIAIFRPNTDVISGKFLEYLFRTPSIKGLAKGYVSGVAVPRIVLKDFKTIELPIPPLQTQKRIADILSAYDDLIENNLKRIKLLEQAAQNIYKEWFVNLRFPGHEITPINEETGLPEGWEEMTLSDFIEFKNGKSLKDKESSETYIVYGSNGVIGKSSFYNREDAIIIGRVGAYCGSINHCKNKFWATDNTITAKAISSKSTNIFCKLLLNNLDLRRFAGGAAQPLLTQRTIIGLTVPLPSFILIKKFTLTADLIKKQSDNLSNLNHSLKAARDILLPRLMNRTIEV